MLGCSKLVNRSQPVVGQSSLYCEDMWRRYCCLWSPYGIWQTIIFSSCGFFLSSIFFFFSSPNLSGRRLDVYHTSSHGVARIENACLKCAACGSLEMQDAKKSPSGHHRTILSGHIFATATKPCIDNRKKLVKHQYLLHMSS